MSTAGRQLFQCCSSILGSPETVVPTFIRIQLSPILSVIGKGPSYCAPSGGGFPFFTSTCVTSDRSGRFTFSCVLAEVCMASLSFFRRSPCNKSFTWLFSIGGSGSPISPAGKVGLRPSANSADVVLRSC